MRLLYNGREDFFYTVSKFEEKDTIKEAGFKWDPLLRIWRTDDVKKAQLLSAYAPMEVIEVLTEKLNRLEEALRLSSQTSIDADVPKPKDLEDDYYPFQKVGIVYASTRPNSLLSDEMGLGKTIQAIGVINSLNLKKILVICPATLKLNWKEELEKWLIDKAPIYVVSGSIEDRRNANIVIINYDILTNHKWILEDDWDVVIVDECSKIKSAKTIRTAAVTEIAAKAKRKIFITGTPILNKPVELLPIIKALGELDKFVGKKKDGTLNEFDFLLKYCGAVKGEWGWDFSGASNLEDLQLKLRENIMIRRLKADVLKELPDKCRQIITLSSDGFEQYLKAEGKKSDILKSVLRSLYGTDDTDYETKVKKLKGVSTKDFTELSILRHKSALFKVPYVIDHCYGILEEENKIVVFAHHHDVIDALKKGLKEFGVVTLTGEDSIESRKSAVDMFQNDNSIRVFIGSIQAAGLGITLTSASVAVFAELDWVPGNISQAEDRIHRIGQKNSVLVQHLVIDKSIDANIAKLLVQKQKIIDKALDK